MKTLSRFFSFTLLVSASVAQPALHLKAWNPYAERPVVPARTRTPARAHWIVQFPTSPTREQLRELAVRGVKVLSYVPDSALAISGPAGSSFEGLGVQWSGRLQPEEKISPLLEQRRVRGANVAVIAEFYSDVDPGDARAIANSAGLIIHENPDLLPHHLLVSGSSDQVRELLNWDEVSYVFPAAQELLTGQHVHGCAGASTGFGPVAQAVALIDQGWDGPGLGSAALNYAFVHVTEKQPAGAVESEIVRAMSQWAQYAQLTYSQASNASAPRTLAVLFATGAHGDAYPFTPGVLAHTFYPVPTNPEPIAGDMHFNDAENWNIGADIDVFSVALHEAGHALGLGHSDNPADVMYPYYRRVSGLAQGDIGAILQLYAAQPGTGSAGAPTAPATPVPPPPLALSAAPPVTPTTAPSIAMSGTVSGGAGTIQVIWRTNQGAMGTAQGSSNWTIPAIPLNVGSNAITIVAQDSQNHQVAESFFVTRIAGAPPPNPTPPPPNPSPGPSAQPSITILSPATTFVATSDASIVVSGTASPSAVTWSTSNGDSGVASGTTNWSTPPIPLYVGTTTIIITATDTAGNAAWRSLTVDRS